MNAKEIRAALEPFGTETVYADGREVLGVRAEGNHVELDLIEAGGDESDFDEGQGA